MIRQLMAGGGQQLLVGSHHGVRYVLICFDDGSYGISRDGELLERRWGLAECEACMAEYLRLIGKPAGPAAAAGQA